MASGCSTCDRELETVKRKKKKNQRHKEFDAEESDSNNEDFGQIGVDSDETFDNACQPCLSEDKNIESKKYCVNCEEYLCETCVEYHKKFKSFKKHQLLNKDEVHLTDQGQFVAPLETCFQHLGQELKLFCKNHDQLCCSTCKATDHRTCDNVVLLKEVASGVRDGEEFATVTEQFKQYQVELSDLASKRENDGERILAERDSTFKALVQYRDDIIEIVEKLKMSDEKRVNSRVEDDSKNIQEDVTNCEEVVVMLTNASELLGKDNCDDMYTFTQLKRAQQNIESARKVICAVSQNVASKKIIYTEDKLISTTLQRFKGLGVLELDRPVYKKTVLEKIKIIGEQEVNTHIMSMCILRNGSCIVMADWENSKLKLLNLSTKAVEASCRLINRPFDVCEVTDNEVAITLLHGKCVKFITVDTIGLFDKNRSFTTVDKCRGIEYFESELYIACGGGVIENEGPGHIGVYTSNGQLQRRIMVDHSGTVATSSPRKIKVSPRSELYILDRVMGLLKIISKDTIIPCFISNNKNNLGGISFDEHDQIFIADFKRNVVEQIGKNGKFVGTVLTGEDGIKKPTSVAYDCKTRQLLVGMQSSPYIHLYHLDYD